MTAVPVRRWLLAFAFVVLALAPFGPPSSAAAAKSQVGGKAQPETRNLQPATPAALPWTPPGTAYRIYVSADGMYRLDYSYLELNGLPVASINPQTFRLFNNGTEIAIQVAGNGDAQFEPGEAVIFYGRSLDSLFYDGLVPTNKYTGANVYWLSYGGPAGLRMADKDGSAAGDAPAPFPRRLHLESDAQNSQYVAANPKVPGADHWYDWWLQVMGTTGSQTRFYTPSIAHLGSPSPDGLVKVSLLGNYAGAHNLRILVNGNMVFDQANLWSDFQTGTAQAAVPASYFQVGSNTIAVRAYNAGKFFDIVYPNWLELTYYGDYYAEADALQFYGTAAGTFRYQVKGFSTYQPGTAEIEAYDVTNPAAVQHFVNTEVTGSGGPGVGPYDLSFGDSTTATSRYMTVGANGWQTPAKIELVTEETSIYTPSDLRFPGGGADYIIISHKDFWADAQRLARWRDTDFTVALVDVQRIYDQFGGGMMSAESIHDFLAYAFANWNPQPLYVMLLGDGSYDFRKYATNADTYIPPYLYPSDLTMGETAADNRFVMLTGNDLVPDMHLGRLPANTADEAKVMVDKIIAYEDPRSCACGAWNHSTLFVADDWDQADANFWDYSDYIANGFVPKPPYNVTKAYLGSTCDVAGNPDPASECQAVIKNTLEQKGALFVSYVGHSTPNQWAGEALLNEPLLSAINQGPCLPVSLPMTCYEGSFQDPVTTALSETAVRMPSRGFIASWAPTGFGAPSGHDLLEKGVVEALLSKGYQRLGPATTYGKQYLWDYQVKNNLQGAYDDLFDTFGLLGDPGLLVKTDAVCALLPTAVRVGTFEARVAGDVVTVHWQTEDELNTAGFRVLRRGRGEANFAAVSSELIPAEHSGSAAGASYQFVDRLRGPARAVQYALEIVKLDGTSEQYGSVDVSTGQAPVYLPLVRW